MKYDANDIKCLHRLLVYAHNESLILKDMELTTLLCMSLQILEKLTEKKERQERSGRLNNVQLNNVPKREKG